MKNCSGSRSIIILAAIVVLTVALCLLGTGFFSDRKFLSFAAIAVALITFFGFLHIGMKANQSSSLTDQDMRTAITASIIVSYLAIMGMSVFFGEAAGEMPPISQMLLTSFTTIVGIVLAFYFGSTAYLDAKKREKTTDRPKNTLNPDAR
jgi:FlaA1/EpsC-like NDP-sugar epimerase